MRMLDESAATHEWCVVRLLSHHVNWRPEAAGREPSDRGRQAAPVTCAWGTRMLRSRVSRLQRRKSTSISKDLRRRTCPPGAKNREFYDFFSAILREKRGCVAKHHTSGAGLICPPGIGWRGMVRQGARSKVQRPKAKGQKAKRPRGQRFKGPKANERRSVRAVASMRLGRKGLSL